MNRFRYRQGLRFAVLLLVASLLFSLLPLPAGAQGDLSAGEITLANPVYEYNGDPCEPAVTITLDGLPLQEGVDFTVSYRHNTDAGTAEATATGTGGYTGSLTASFLIRPRRMTRRDLSFQELPLKPYDGTTGITFSAELATVSDDQVTARCQGAFSDCYAGRSKEVRVTGITLSGRDRANYELDLTYPILLENGQITPCEPRVKTEAELAAGGHTLDLNTLIEPRGPGQTVRFPESLDSLGSTLSPEGVLTSGSSPETLSIPVTLEAFDENGDGQPEYTLAQQTITVRVVERESQAPVTVDPTPGSGGGGGGGGSAAGGRQQSSLTFSGSASVSYNDTLDLGVTGGSGEGEIVYTVRSISGNATVNDRGILTPTRAGTVWVTARKKGDDRYSDGTPVSLEVTIRPARVTVTVLDKTARVGGEAPDLGEGDYTVTGLKSGEKLKRRPTLAYASRPDLSRPGTVAIHASGAEVPDTGNYESAITYRDGTLTILEAPEYAVTLVQKEHGTLSADRKTAREGEQVTVTAQGEQGYLCARLSVQTEKGKPVAVIAQGGGVYTFAMPASPVTVSGQFTPDEGQMPFVDVSASDWFYDSVFWAWRTGLMKGVSADRFDPRGTTSRAMIVTILYRLEGSPDAPKASPFTDVKQDSYYAAPVAWAAWNGIVSGYSLTSFGPNDPITREQFAAILYRYADFRRQDVTWAPSISGFSDAQRVSAYARTPMAWAVAEGLITGMGNGVLDPGGQATRAQAAAILQRFVERFPLSPQDQTVTEAGESGA